MRKTKESEKRIDDFLTHLVRLETRSDILCDDCDDIQKWTEMCAISGLIYQAKARFKKMIVEQS